MTGHQKFFGVLDVERLKAKVQFQNLKNQLGRTIKVKVKKQNFILFIIFNSNKNFIPLILGILTFFTAIT